MTSDPEPSPPIHVGAEEVAPPGAVTEAEDEVRSLGLRLAGAGAAGTAVYWASVFAVGFPFVPVSWWVLFLLALVAFFFFPPTRKANAARAVLRRWDDLKVERALERDGTSTDPRVRMAARMAARVLEGPSLTGPEREIVSTLLASIRQTGRDLALAEAAQPGGDAGLEPGGRALSDLLDTLEARLTRLLGALAELHSAVVRRERVETRALLDEARDLLGQVEAETEVERLLARGEPPP